MSVQIKVEDHSSEFWSAFNVQIEAALETIGLQAEGYAKAECPVDTGNLRNSISHTVMEDAAYIGTNVEYAPYQELGVPSRNIKAHHFLKRAASDHVGEYERIVKSYLSGT